MKLTKDFQVCPVCKLSYLYDIMLVDDLNILRVGGVILNHCPARNMCKECCKETMKGGQCLCSGNQEAGRS
jgi:hypothetical protein